MSVALLLIALLVSAFYFWQGKKTLNAEMRGRAVYEARNLSVLIVDDLITRNKAELYKKLKSHFTVNESLPDGGDVLYLMVYDHKGELLAGGSATEASSNDGPHSLRPVSGRFVPNDAALSREAKQIQGPFFMRTRPEIYDVTLSVLAGNERVGFVRVGISGQQYAKKLSSIAKQAAVVLLCIILVGIVFSRIIALGISKPIVRLSEAAEMLGRQNWDSPLPIHGKDEIGKLGYAFRQMALALKQREFSLSRGNRDLFILHKTGLDLLESLDLNALLVKIAARAEDLVKADTTAVTVVDENARTLKYLDVLGSKEQALKDLGMPLEGGGIYNWLACQGTPLLIADARSDFRLDDKLMQSLGIDCLMVVPLWSSNRMTGMLSVANKKDGTRFDKHDLRLFTVFSNLAGSALQNASLYTDLTEKMNELRRTQEQLVHSTKMAAIGELAAHVAHEVNNPLTSVLGYTTHLLKTLDLPESPRRVLAMMEQETLRVRKIIRKLLDFPRRKGSVMQPADVLIPLRETAAFVQGAAVSSSVKIHEEYDCPPVLVNIDANEMKQVFINIINNAFQAMPGGGDLRIRFSKASDHEALIEFADTGVGILPENTAKIFEPFFSTKDNEDGTGLGLAISYRILQNHGGRIEVESEVGKGSVFKVYLPIYKKTAVMSQ
jgi:signal transduction histidine kinase/HAMP domain-containing protein